MKKYQNVQPNVNGVNKQSDTLVQNMPLLNND